VFRWTCGDYTRVLPTLCARGCGCSGHPAFPAPSVFEGQRSVQLGRIAPRDGGCMSGFDVIARSESDEAIRTASAWRILDCFASLAMTQNRLRPGCLKIESEICATHLRQGYGGQATPLRQPRLLLRCLLSQVRHVLHGQMRSLAASGYEVTVNDCLYIRARGTTNIPKTPANL
jgi:hypothetical protein